MFPDIFLICDQPIFRVSATDADVSDSSNHKHYKGLSLSFRKSCSLEVWGLFYIPHLQIYCRDQGKSCRLEAGLSAAAAAAAALWGCRGEVMSHRELIQPLAEEQQSPDTAPARDRGQQNSRELWAPL